MSNFDFLLPNSPPLVESAEKMELLGIWFGLMRD